MKTRLVLVVVFAVAVLAMGLTGCASYGTKGAIPMIGRIEEQRKAVAVEKEGVIIEAIPVLTAGDSKKYFDTDDLFYGKRILAVYLDILNRNAEPIKVNSVNLVTNQVVGSSLASIDTVYDAVKKGYVGKAVVWMIPTFYFGAIPSMIHTAAINEEIRKDLVEKQFAIGVEIKPLGSSQGFIWFQLKKEGMPNGFLPAGTRLSFIIEKLTNEVVVVELAITETKSAEVEGDGG